MKEIIPVIQPILMYLIAIFFCISFVLLILSGLSKDDVWKKDLKVYAKTSFWFGCVAAVTLGLTGIILYYATVSSTFNKVNNYLN